MSSSKKHCDISICIASFRRPEKLKRLLNSLEKAIPRVSAAIEIVVVDNDRLKSAKSIVEKHQTLATNIWYFLEPRQNISRARNLSVEKANGNWVAFVDDDEIVDENWLLHFWNYQSQNNADGYFGPVLPKLEETAPDWFDEKLLFNRPRFATGTKLMEKMRTGNAFIRTSLFHTDNFDLAYGLTGGGDAVFFERMARKGYSFYWNDDAITYELYPKERTQLRWLIQRSFRSGLTYSRSRLQSKGNWYRIFVFIKAMSVMLFLTLTLVLRFLQSSKMGVAQFLRICLQWGHLAACFNITYYEYKN
ncbi:MAG: glycosyltransferase [Calditrichaeota bacterium]|nr:MAG: glycosyltransferase [Calditrichota bacterium]